jgi:folylpolyglutamate synthase/dihydropteroate synthase
MADKDLTGMLSELAPVARPLLLTQAPRSRAASVADLAAAASSAGVTEPILEADIDRALERAWSAAPTIAVAGSLYLAGAILARVERDEAGAP